MPSIVSTKTILQNLLEACRLTACLDPAEVADFADALYGLPFDQWTILQVDPPDLISLLKSKHVFDGWTDQDNQISGRYSSLQSDPPPVVLFLPDPNNLIVLDGRHRLVSRKHTASIAVACPSEQVDQFRRLLNIVQA